MMHSQEEEKEPAIDRKFQFVNVLLLGIIYVPKCNGRIQAEVF